MDGSREVTIEVLDVAEAPTAAADSATTAEDTAVDISVLDNDSDQDEGDSLTITAFTQPGNGAVAYKAGSDKKVFTYTPEANWHGEDTFTYTVSDKTSRTATATVTVTVTSVNDAPVITDGKAKAALFYAEDGTGPVVSYTASDPDTGDTLAWSLSGDDAGVFNLSDAGVLTFKTAPDYESPADDDEDNGYLLTVQLSDGKNAAGEADATADATQNVYLRVTNVNEAPVGVDDAVTTGEDTPVNIPVLANDTDPDWLAGHTVAGFTQPGTAAWPSRKAPTATAPTIPSITS